MKKIFLLLTVAALFSCTDHSKKAISPKGTTAIQIGIQQKMNIIKSDNKDTVNISTDDCTLIKYTKDDLRRILKTNPELNDNISYGPDICWGESLKNNNEYDCEVCRDEYYALYAYFLKENNGEAKYRQQRKMLIGLYRDINRIFDILEGGGTYYGHQYTRILAYAEYSVYTGKDKDNDYYIKSYNMVGQKDLYIKSLKQFIDDEVNNDQESSPNEKAKKQKELLKNLNDIDRLITTYFYLSKAREFQYSHY